MASAKQFYSRDAANKGMRVDLIGRDRKPSGEWLQLLHMDSDNYRAAVSETLERLSELAAQPDAELLRDAQKEFRLEVIASLVSGWSLEEDCNKATIIELLKNAPYLVDYIDKKAADHAAFFGNASIN